MRIFRNFGSKCVDNQSASSVTHVDRIRCRKPKKECKTSLNHNTNIACVISSSVKHRDRKFPHYAEKDGLILSHVHDMMNL